MCSTRQLKHIGDIKALVWVLSTSRGLRYSIMNRFYSQHESRVPVERHRPLEVCRVKNSVEHEHVSYFA